jgi:hypothetical protein
MLTVQLGVNAEGAFARLRAHAYANERPLGEVARSIVERRLRFDQDRGTDPEPGADPLAGGDPAPGSGPVTGEPP